MADDTGRGGRPGARRAVLAAVSAALMATASPATATAAESVPRWTAQRMTGSVGSMHVVTGTNNRGQVIGWGVTPDAEWRSFLWDGERLTAPPTLPDGSEPQFQAINDRGQVAGYDKLADGSRRAVLWSADGRPRALGATGIVGVQDLKSAARSSSTGDRTSAICCGTASGCVRSLRPALTRPRRPHRDTSSTTAATSWRTPTRGSPRHRSRTPSGPSSGGTARAAGYPPRPARGRRRWSCQPGSPSGAWWRPR